jgi:GTPase SAR1 family protein
MTKVVLIGDRGVGKTSMVYALFETPHEKVEPKEGPSGDFAATDKIETGNLGVIVVLPAQNIELSLVWIDTPGELQTNRKTQDDNPEIWEKLCQEVQTSDYVMLLLPPHQGLCHNKNIPDINSFPTSEQSKNRFKAWWIPFLSQNSQKAKNILICRHKADLFIANIQEVGNQYKYRYANEGFSWKNYCDFSARYFREVDDEISQYRNNPRHQEVRLFVTTVKNRSLLELPWIYIATRESTRPKY